jgi:environmental stress-induced protein Ves
MATLVHLSARDYRRMPWRNGGGTTTELVAEPDAGGGFLWRLSIAEVAVPGPFSDFPGVERTILLLAGRGMVLHLAGAPPRRIDRPLEPFTFDGGLRVECELVDGPVRDLNLMVARGKVAGTLRVLRIPRGSRVELPHAGTVLLHLVEGSLDVGGVTLRPDETLRGDGAAGALPAVAGDPGAVAVLVGLSPAVP